MPNAARPPRSPCRRSPRASDARADSSAGFRAVRAPQARNRRASLPGAASDDARGLRGDEGLEMQQVHHPAFDELRLAQRAPRCAGSARRRRRPSPRAWRRTSPVKRRSASEARNAPREAPAAPEPVELLRREAQGLEVVEHLLEAGRDEVVAPLGELAHEELEDRRGLHAPGEVRLEHGELVEVGEQHAGGGRRIGHANPYWAGNERGLGKSPHMAPSCSGGAGPLNVPRRVYSSWGDFPNPLTSTSTAWHRGAPHVLSQRKNRANFPPARRGPRCGLG